jgi:hypothetical protein
MPETVTDPGGTVHVLIPSHRQSVTVCGQNADGWSRAVTIAQVAGLVLKCEACDA